MIYTKILIPLDGSALSESILPYARFLAKALKVPAELVYSIDPETISYLSTPDRSRPIVEAKLKQSGLDYLEPVSGSFPESLAVVCSVIVGKPVDVIVERAAAEAGTLIAMATHGHSGLQRWALGSVADRVLHLSANHLFLVRPPRRAQSVGVAQLKKIIVPLDGSALSEQTLPYVALLATNMNLELLLLRVFSLPLPAYFVGGEHSLEWVKLAEPLKSEAGLYLEDKARRLQEEGVKKVSSMVLEGNAAEAIIEFARQTPDTLVAMCTHGRSGIGRWVMGSVSERVVRYSENPVLMIRARERR